MRSGYGRMNVRIVRKANHLAGGFLRNTSNDRFWESGRMAFSLRGRRLWAGYVTDVHSGKRRDPSRPRLHVLPVLVLLQCLCAPGGLCKRYGPVVPDIDTDVETVGAALPVSVNVPEQVQRAFPCAVPRHHRVMAERDRQGGSRVVYFGGRDTLSHGSACVSGPS